MTPCCAHYAVKMTFTAYGGRLTFTGTGTRSVPFVVYAQRFAISDDVCVVPWKTRAHT